MAYQGISPYLYRNNLTNVQLLDDISGSFNGTKSQFNLTTNGSPFHAVSARSLLIILGGIVQEPDADYTVNAGVITFTTAPLSGLTFAARNIYGLNRLTGINDGLVTPASLSLGGPEWDTSGNLTVDGNITQTGETNNVYINTDTPTVRPTLYLNFERDQRLDSRITYSRNSTATYLGSDGLIKTALVNEPRFEFDTDGNCLGFLIEESRTNIVTYSENFNLWGTEYRTTISINAAISPSGQLNAAKFNVTTDTGYHARSLNIAGGTYTVSIFAKAGEYNGIQITGTNTTEDHACFNLVNGTAYHSGTNVTDIKIENFGNGWYRCSARLPLTNGSFFIAITDGITTSWLPPFTGSNASDGIYIWGAQVEAGSFPTSYIPTSGSTVTRSADSASITGTNFSSWFGSTEGSILMNFKSNMLSSNDCVVLSFDDGSRYPWPIYRFNPTIDNYWKWYNGNDGIVNIKSGFSNSEYKFGFAFNQTNGSSAESGTLTQTDITQLRMLSKYSSSNRMYIFRNIDDGFVATTTGTVNKLIVYPNKLSDSALQQLTQ